MKKRICIMRHAKAEPFGLVPDDFSRTLVPRGVAEAKRTGSLIKKEHFMPELLVASSAPRALYSLRFAAEAFGMNPDDVISDSRIYSAGPGGLLELVRAFPDDVNTAMLCGHNPSVSELLSALCPEGGFSMRTAEAACLELETEKWADIGRTPSKKIFFIATNERQ